MQTPILQESNYKEEMQTIILQKKVLAYIFRSTADMASAIV